MNETLLDCMSRQMMAGYAPVIRMNALMLSAAEEMMELEINAMKTYADLSFDLARSMVCVNQPEDVQQCSESFMKTIGELNKQFIEHAQAHHQMGVSFREKIDEVL